MDDQLELEQARAARDEGIQTAVDHADAVEPKWSDQAFAFLEAFMRTRDTFTAEQAAQFVRANLEAIADQGIPLENVA